MATDAVKRVQEKLFRGGTSTPEPIQPASPIPALTINIPKPPSTPTQPPKREKQPDSSPKNPQVEESEEANTDTRTYRERLASKLGNDYKGAEKYRLQQDGKKERHWKRWGPYLSDRQWVSICLPSFGRID